MSSNPESQRRDARRLAEIDRYGLADLPPRRDLDGLAELAARLCGVSMAMITYIDGTHLHTLATVGFDAGTVPRAVSLCNEVLYDGEALVAADLLADPRHRDSFPARQGIARFYASQQLVLPNGEPVGSLCVFDPEPRTLDDGQRRLLRDLAERVVDVLELDLRTRDLTSAVAELRRSNDALASFAGQVSHDLRNPLGAVSGTLELLDDLAAAAEPDAATMRPLVARASRAVNRMVALVDDVLELAAVGGALDLRPVDVAQLVTDVRDDLATELDGTVLGVGDLAPVVADPVHLRIVVQNLLSNAARHGGRGPSPRIEVTAATGDGSWRLTVVDHGPGVDDADRQRVFEPFVRIDPSVAGTGVGLATCRRIVHAHGGDIGLEETPGGGTTVWLELPATT